MRMPRKPTTYSKAARTGILALLEEQSETTPLPTLRELGKTFELHPSTIFRLLRDMEVEGIVWQSPSGSFFPASARSQKLHGAPISFIGREMWQWSPLYQEIMEGVAEVCSINESPLIFQSSPDLVRVPVHLQAPIFGSASQQKKDLTAMVEKIPRACAGVLLDHLWSDRALGLQGFPGSQPVQILYGTGKYAKAILPDYQGGAEIAAHYIRQHGFENVILVIPFPGDPAIQHCLALLRNTLGEFSPKEVAFHGDSELQKLLKSPPKACCIVCPEDSTAQALTAMVEAAANPRRHPLVVLATQGTGVITAPHARLRYDYRRIGRAAASYILHGTDHKLTRPQLVTAEEDGIG